jgi:dTMP kinase
VKGKFITLEGGEASGKSTNIQFISKWLAARQIPHVLTHEPGGTPFAESIRQLLLMKQPEPIASDAELLLMFASRAQHIAQVIKPALDSGKWVICSRFTDSSYAYQGGGRGLPMEKIAQLEHLVQGDLQPDLTILLDLPVEIALERARHRGELDRIEAEDVAFFERVRAVYLARAKAFPERFRVIETTTFEHVQLHLDRILREKGFDRP